MTSRIRPPKPFYPALPRDDEEEATDCDFGPLTIEEEQELEDFPIMAPSNWTRPLFADLTWDSTREEVLAAVAEAEQRSEDLMDRIKRDGVRGCRLGPSKDNERSELERRQALAGEEDQDDGEWAIG